MSPPADRLVMSLVEAGMALASELDLDGLLQRIADISREVIGARYGAVGVLGSQGELVRFVYSGIVKQLADTIGGLPVGRGVLGALIEEGTPLRLQEISDHPRSYGFPDDHPPMHSFLGVPIVVRDHIFGRLNLTEKQGSENFTKDDERIALSFAAQAGVAIDNAGLIEELKARGEILAILEERDRISRDLHDGVIQSIYSVGLSIQGAMTLIERDPDGTRRRMDEVIVTLDNVVRDVRSYIFALQPKSVEERGLKRGIEELIEDLKVNALAETSVELSETALEMIPEAAKGDMIQIVRGVLSNIARHARATQVSVECAVRDDRVVMSIEDDGIGFDPATIQRGDGHQHRRTFQAHRWTVRHLEARTKRHGAHLVSSRGEELTMAESLKVMLVDDHEIVRQGLRSLLEAEADIEVVAEADNGPSAVSLARTHQPDVVVMDVRMPRGSGVEACRAIRDERPDAQVIMLTSFSDDEALFKSIMAGAAGFVLKQIRGTDLVDAIRTVGSGRSLLDPDVTKRVLERLRKAKFDDKDPKLARLSPQEERILDMIGEGLTNREIAGRIHLSDKTVKNYVSTILQKLDVARRAEAAAYIATARAEHPQTDV